MGFLDKAKVAAGAAATTVQEGATRAQKSMDVVQAKRGAEKAYGELGREAFRLVEAGEISNRRERVANEHRSEADERERQASQAEQRARIAQKEAEAERAQAEHAAGARASQAEPATRAEPAAAATDEPAAPPPPATPS